MRESNSNQPGHESVGSSAVSSAPAPPASPARHQQTPPWLPWTFLLLALLVSVSVRVRLLDFPLERDEGEYAYMGQLIQEGIPPYKLAYNMKMPGIYLAYAGIMSLFGQTAAGIHLGLLMVNVATWAVLFLIARKWLDLSGAVVATGAYALMTLSPAYLGLAAHATHFVVLPALLGFWMLFRVENQERLWGCLAAGCLFGTAFLMKQQGALLGIFGGLYLARASLAGKMPWGQVLRRLASYALGCLLPFLAICLWLKMAGIFPAFWFWTISYARQYAGVLTVHEGMVRAGNTLAGLLHAAPLLWAVAGAGLVCLLLTRQPWNTRVFLGGLLLFSVLAVCPGLYFRQHYFIVLLPAVGLLAGLAVSWSGQWLAGTCSAPLLGRLPLFLGVLAGAQSLYADRIVLFSLSPAQACRAVYAGNPFPESPAIARYLEAHTRKDQRIQVIGSEPQIYFHAHRHSSSGYIYSLPLLQPQPFARTMQEDMIREILRNPPAYLVLVSDPMSWEAQSGSSRRLIDWVSGYLNQCMEQVGLVQGFDTPVTESIWGPQAATVPVNSDWYVAVFKRVETAKTGNRAPAIARNKLLMDKFNNCPIDVGISHYLNALRLNPKDAGAHFNLGNLYARKLDIDAAITEYQTVLQLDPNFAGAHNNLGKALTSKGLMVAAMQQFHEALRLNPKDAQAHVNLGEALNLQGQTNAALSEFETAARLSPQVSITRDHLGDLLARMGRREEAISQYQEAIRLDPQDAALHDQLGNLFVGNGQNDAAMSEFQAALHLNPGDAILRDNLGNLFARLGRNDEAISQFEEALQIKPDDAKAHDNLGIVLVKRGRMTEAINQFAEAVRLRPDFVKAHDNLGFALASQGRGAEAIQQYRAALRLNPEDTDAQSNLAKALALDNKSSGGTSAPAKP